RFKRRRKDREREEGNMDSRTKQMILSTLCKHFSLDSGGAGASTGCFEPPLEEGHCFHISEMWRLVEMSFSGHTYGWLSDGTCSLPLLHFILFFLLCLKTKNVSLF
ncbi:hypothetical protein HID58_046912, partial [Brassica napus]